MGGRLLRGPSGALVLLGIPLAVAACTNTSGEVRGGEPRFDAALPDPLVVTVTEPTFADAPPTSWKGIYRDFLGRRAKASCAGNGTCHDAAGKPGANSSNFVCGDVEGCYTSLRTSKPLDPSNGVKPLVDDADIAAPDGAYFFRVVRFRTPDGTLVPNRGMPQQPTDYAYSAEDVTRIKAWITAGAKND